jgi:hypothetical protein
MDMDVKNIIIFNAYGNKSSMQLKYNIPFVFRKYLFIIMLVDRMLARSVIETYHHG